MEADFQCVYDCNSGAPSTDEYHILPYSASTLELTLPAGVVCDKCNNAFAPLESHFTQFHPGSSARVMHVESTRKGKAPSFRHQHGSLTREDREGHREIKTNLNPASFQIELIPGESMQIRGGYTPKPFDATIVSRVLHKIALETLALVNDPQLDPRAERYKPLRDYVRRPKVGEFRPFVWLRGDVEQEAPMGITATENSSGRSVSFCKISFPGILYLVAYPPWPVPDDLWKTLTHGTLVNAPGLIELEPEVITQTYREMTKAEYEAYLATQAGTAQE